MGEFEFGIVLSAKHLAKGGWGAYKDVTLECERLGYHSIWLGDHLSMGGYRLECWTVLSALSTITEKIRLDMVLCNSFRSPSLLAKMAASLDVISGGRLEFGIGAGFLEPEYHAYGFPFPKLSMRVEQLEEALEIIKRMWTQERPSYEGKYYQIREAVCEPKPIQKPHPPITIAGGNEKYTLKVVAKHADKWIHVGSPEEYKRKLRILERLCSNIGRDPKEIKKSILVNYVGVYENKVENMKAMKKVYEREEKRHYRYEKEIMPFKDWLEEIKGGSIIGTQEECLKTIEKYSKIGITSFKLRFPELLEKRKVLKNFKKKIMENLLREH